MIFATRYLIKNKSLTPWIKFIWYFEAQEADISYKLLPTDCIDIILNLSGDIIYESKNESILAPYIHVNGLRRGHSFIHQRGNIKVMGISFYSYGLFPLIQESLENAQDKILSLSELSPSLSEKLKIAISKGKSVENFVENIESALCQELNITTAYLEKANLIQDFLETNNEITLLAFCLAHGINPKTFTRSALRYTGYTPKILRSIKTFQKAGNQLVHPKPVKLSEIAYDNAFSDQAHFAREFRRFAGTSPGAFQMQKMTVKENIKYNYK